MAEIDILIEAEGWQNLPHATDLADRAARSALIAEGREAGAVAILLTDDRAMQALNAGFRGKDKPTNVLSFPASAMPGADLLFLGDIALGYETCQAEAFAEGKSLGDHLSHLVVHGCLHLMGYDHETEAQAEQMEERERVILASLGIADPYSGAEGAPLDE
jgi:probable rRNA maturation factor